MHRIKTRFRQSLYFENETHRVTLNFSTINRVIREKAPLFPFWNVSTKQSKFMKPDSKSIRTINRCQRISKRLDVTPLVRPWTAWTSFLTHNFSVSSWAIQRLENYSKIRKPRCFWEWLNHSQTATSWLTWKKFWERNRTFSAFFYVQFAFKSKIDEIARSCARFWDCRFIINVGR